MKTYEELLDENKALSAKLSGVLDELCDFKSALDGMLMSGMSADQMISQLEKQLSFHV